jgi:hypothetical protein
VHPDTGESVEYKSLLNSSTGPAWEQANCDEIGRLTQGHLRPDGTRVAGTETIHFIHVNQLPPGRKATYLKIVVADKLNKELKEHVRWTCGGNKVDYSGDCSTKTVGLATAKCLFNSFVSTPSAKFMCLNIKNFYLNTPMAEYEYMCIAVKCIPDRIMTEYNLKDKVHKDFVYVEIRKGMYGLPQAGKIANDRLVKHLSAHGYHQAEHTHGLFTHTSRPGLMFSLVVDDFGVQHTNKADAEHLAFTLKLMYEVTNDWSGTKYLGLTLRWDYQARTCDLSMPGYIARALARFAIPAPVQPQHSPHSWQRPNYGAKTPTHCPHRRLAAPFPA